MNKLTAGKSLRMIFFLILTVIMAFQIYPIFWVIMSSLKTPEELSGGASYALPSGLYLGNYIKALMKSNLIRYFLNSTTVAVFTLIGIVAVGCPAAFAISKIKFKYANKLMMFFCLE